MSQLYGLEAPISSSHHQHVCSSSSVHDIIATDKGLTDPQELGDTQTLIPVKTSPPRLLMQELYSANYGIGHRGQQRYLMEELYGTRPKSPYRSCRWPPSQQSKSRSINCALSLAIVGMLCLLPLALLHPDFATNGFSLWPLWPVYLIPTVPYVLCHCKWFEIGCVACKTNRWSLFTTASTHR